MTEDFIEEKFKELIYVLGEIDFDIIKKESWDKYINRDESFNSKQIESLRYFTEELMEDFNNLK